jgi:hypothetical protein
MREKASNIKILFAIVFIAIVMLPLFYIAKEIYLRETNPAYAEEADLKLADTIIALDEKYSRLEAGHEFILKGNEIKGYLAETFKYKAYEFTDKYTFLKKGNFWVIQNPQKTKYWKLEAESIHKDGMTTLVLTEPLELNDSTSSVPTNSWF